MKIISTITLTFLLTLAFISCNKVAPAGFWKSYQADLLVKNISDQGPNGGHRAMFWKADKKSTFSSSNILEFAARNGWTLIDSSEFDQDQVSKWTYSNKPIFPLTSKGFSDTILNDAILENFPRWFNGQIKLYKFKTTWVTIEPGTDKSIDENGFVVINKDETEFTVYHLWGD